MISEGHYRTRLVSGGPWVPVRVWRPEPIDPDTGERLDRWPRLHMIVAASARNPYDPLIRVVRRQDVEVWRPAFERWPSLEPITAEEWAFLIRLGEWCGEHAPCAPEAKPDEAVDLRRLPSLY